MSDTLLLIKQLADKYGHDRKALMPILQGIVEKDKYLSDYAMVEVAHELDLSAAQVYGTASFYAFLDTEFRGENVIRVCKTITCDMHGRREIIQVLEDELKIKVGQTTSDKKFTLLETNCLGWCHKGPAMLINDLPYTELTTEKVREIITEYKAR